MIFGQADSSTNKKISYKTNVKWCNI